MKKALVYGASGFIGENLLRKLLENNVEVIAVIPDATVDGSAYDRIAKYAVEVVQCNLKDVKSKLKNLICTRIDVVYFLGWDGLTNDGLLDYERQINNATYMLDLMKVTASLGAKRFIGSGSITQQELFREEGRNYLTDKHKYYRSVQQMCEDLGRALACELSITFIWPLITNVYGVGEKSPRLVNSLIRALLKNENFPTSEGEQLYDFIYIEDAVNIYYNLGICEINSNHDKYIIGSGKPLKLKDYLSVIPTLIEGDGKIQFGKFKYSGMYYLEKELDATPLLKDLQYTIQNDFELGIQKTIEWIKSEDC